MRGCLCAKLHCYRKPNRERESIYQLLPDPLLGIQQRFIHRYPKALKLTLGAWPSSKPGRFGVFPPIGEAPDFCVGGFQGTPPGKPTFVDLFEAYDASKTGTPVFGPGAFPKTIFARPAALPYDRGPATHPSPRSSIWASGDQCCSCCERRAKSSQRVRHTKC